MFRKMTNDLGGNAHICRRSAVVMLIITVNGKQFCAFTRHADKKWFSIHSDFVICIRQPARKMLDLNIPIFPFFHFFNDFFNY